MALHAWGDEEEGKGGEEMGKRMYILCVSMMIPMGMEGGSSWGWKGDPHFKKEQLVYILALTLHHGA